jgi:hypothetical protein
MGTIAAALAILGMGAFHIALANCADVPSDAPKFMRSHQVHHFNGDPPSTVEDELVIWQPADGGNCFLLTTVGPNYHQCELAGQASLVESNKLEYKQGNCTITLQRAPATVDVTVSPGWQRMGEGGTCAKTSCGMYGGISSGTFRARR